MIATSGFLTALECTKFLFGRGSEARWGSLQRSPKPPSWFKGPTTKGNFFGKLVNKADGTVKDFNRVYCNDRL